ncbi:hypothetical protein BKA60DRAFT_532802 [Fusarium oxysporum]|nr:hypothetical protein BKA60DRAFT_532802 [Fusarium oxysporum]
MGYGSGVLAPLSSLILLNVDSLGGLEPAVKLVARWMTYSSLVDSLPSPQLLVISKEAVDYTQIGQFITTELLCLLRESHPERPHSRDEVVEMWNRRLGGIQYICNDSHSSIVVYLKAASQVRLCWGLRFSSLNFKDLLQKAVIASWQNNRNFNVLQALGIHNPLTTDASGYLSQFLASDHGRDRLIVASSCLAYRTYCQASHVFHPELVFQSFVKPVLLRMPLSLSNGKSITQHHIVRMRDDMRVTCCGCNLCLLGTPIHMISCGHCLCSYCATVTQESSPDGKCVLCGIGNTEAFEKQPLPAGIRTLELFGAKPPLRFLHEVRKLLFGHLAEYVDLVAGAEPALQRHARQEEAKREKSA